jgi:outer membrane murein-binding lipoprotein Lpp
MRTLTRPPVLLTITLISLCLAIASLVMVGWIVKDPHRWLPNNASAVDELSSRVDDLETGSGDQASANVDDLASRVDDLESRIDDLETGGGDQAGMSVDDLSTTVGAICDGLSGYEGAFQDIYLSAC